MVYRHFSAKNSFLHQRIPVISCFSVEYFSRHETDTQIYSLTDIINNISQDTEIDIIRILHEENRYFLYVRWLYFSVYFIFCPLFTFSFREFQLLSPGCLFYIASVCFLKERRLVVFAPLYQPFRFHCRGDRQLFFTWRRAVPTSSSLPSALCSRDFLGAFPSSLHCLLLIFFSLLFDFRIARFSWIDPSQVFLYMSAAASSAAGMPFSLMRLLQQVILSADLESFFLWISFSDRYLDYAFRI